MICLCGSYWFQGCLSFFVCQEIFFRLSFQDGPVENVDSSNLKIEKERKKDKTLKLGRDLNQRKIYRKVEKDVDKGKTTHIFIISFIICF